MSSSDCVGKITWP